MSCVPLPSSKSPKRVGRPEVALTAVACGWYPEHMAVDPRSNLIDLSGLPEPVVQEIRKLVQQARARLAAETESADPASGETGPPLNGHPMGKSTTNPRESRDEPELRAAPVPRFILAPRPYAEEARRLTAQIASMPSGHALPADFSRADIYDDHD